MAIPANDLWAKLQKELGGKSNPEQLVILRRYLDAWPDEWKGPYQALKERLVKLERKLQTTEAVKSATAREDPFAVKRGGDAQVALIGLTNTGKSALVATLTHARTEVSDHPFTTHLPSPGMLDHLGAAIQLIDTPPIVPGLARGEGPGLRLLQLIRVVEALGVVVDLSEEPLRQLEVIHQELATANVLLRPHPLNTVLELKGKGGIKFRGAALAKDLRVVAARLLAEHDIAHAEVIVRSTFSIDELSAQLARKRLMPALIIGNKNDVPGASAALTALRAHYSEYAVVDVNFLDAMNFDVLKASLFAILGLVRVFLLDRPTPDASTTTMVLPRASSIGDLIDSRWSGRSDRPVHARIWGPSAKYAGQGVALEHLVCDSDCIFLQT
jgi:hypothetical protein